MQAYLKPAVLAAVVAALVLGGCAGTGERNRAEAVQRDCFSASSVSGFHVVDDTRVRLNVGVGDVYEATLLSYCPDVDWSQRIGLRTSGGGSRICTSDPLGVELVVPDHTGQRRADRCRVRTLRKLSPEEAAAHRGDKAEAGGSIRHGRQLSGG